MPERQRHRSESDAATLTMIKQRFAGNDAAADLAFKTSDSFRGLCRDYLSCVAALARWEQAPSQEARLRSQEYSDLLIELTNEILARLGGGQG